MTCPFCGADVIVSLDGVPESYECGSGDLRQSKTCQELCRLREKKAKGLEWEWVKVSGRVGGGYWKAMAVAGGCGVSEMRTYSKYGPYQLETSCGVYKRFKTVDLAKAHAEELHQQAWRELRNKWSAK